MKESPARFADLKGMRLYRRNIFAVTGLPVDARDRTVRREKTRIDAMLAVQETWRGDADSPVREGYRGRDVRAAFEEFRDPRRRLVDELMWLWRDTDLGCACAPGTHRRHDEAVLRHSRAVEAERAAALSDDRLDELWTEAADSWAKVLDSPDLRAHIAHRMTALSDPRFDDHTPDDFLTGIPRLLLSPFATIAGDRAARPRLAGACHGWQAQPAFAGLLQDTFEAPVTRAFERIGEGLKTAAEKQRGDAYWDALLLLGDEVLPAFEDLEPLKPFAPASQYEELRHRLAVALNNVALAIHTEGSHSRFQKKRAVELMETAYEIAPARDEQLIHENLTALYDHRVGRAQPRPAAQTQPGGFVACGLPMLTIAGAVVAGLTGGAAWAIGIVVGGFVLLGMLS